MKPTSPKLIFVLLISLAFTLATSAHLRAISRPDADSSDGAFKKLLGDGRRLFAGQFVEMADVYLHSGLYPSIFDRREANAPKAVAGKTEEDDDHDHEGHQHDEKGDCVHPDEPKDHKAEKPQDEHEKAMDFMGQPRDWLEGFIRRFRITKHSHLEKGEEREILPWLKLAIELDPQAIETYTATAFWLRKNLGNAEAAETVLREGIRNNPGNPEVLLEMGMLYKESSKDPVRARNIWLLALRRWDAQTDETKKDGLRIYGRITANLARLETEAGNWPRALQYFELAKAASPKPEAIQDQINEIRIKIGPTNSSPSAIPAP